MQKAYHINLGKSDRKITKFSCRELTCSPNNSKNDKWPAQLFYIKQAWMIGIKKHDQSQLTQ